MYMKFFFQEQTHQRISIINFKKSNDTAFFNVVGSRCMIILSKTVPDGKKKAHTFIFLLLELSISSLYPQNMTVHTVNSVPFQMLSSIPTFDFLLLVKGFVH